MREYLAQNTFIKSKWHKEQGAGLVCNALRLCHAVCSTFELHDKLHKPHVAAAEGSRDQIVPMDGVAARNFLLNVSYLGA